MRWLRSCARRSTPIFCPPTTVSPIARGRRVSRKAAWSWTGPTSEPARSSPAVPAIPGIETVPYLTSTTALELEELPKSLLVIGGGYVGAELAQVFARAGVKLTLVCRSRLLPEAEPEISVALTGYFADEGDQSGRRRHYRAIRKTESGISLLVARNGQDLALDADQVLVTTGRAPNIEGLGLAELGIAVSAKGGIAVDDRMRTTRPGVYAVGDVTGRDQFVYMAAHGAKLAARNALNGDSQRYDNAAMPAVVFTDPQVASVGLTEAAAGHDVDVLYDRSRPGAPCTCRPRHRGLIKLVAEAGSGEACAPPRGRIQVQERARGQRGSRRSSSRRRSSHLTTVEGIVGRLEPHQGRGQLVVLRGVENVIGARLRHWIVPRWKTTTW